MEIGTFSDDGSVTPEMPSVQWWTHLQEAFTRMGKPMIACARYPELMKEAGLVNVHSRLLKRPTNDWPKDPRMKEIGRVSQHLPFPITSSASLLLPFNQK